MSGAREPRIRTPRSRTGIAAADSGRSGRSRGRLPSFGGRIGVIVGLAVIPVAGRDCRRTPEKPVPAAREAPTPAPTVRPELFAATVRPVLTANCNPCHYPGGKMYEQLPFDNPEVVADHRAGVLRRIKQTDEREAIVKWLASVDGSKTDNR